jgi:hypothetical protein
LVVTITSKSPIVATEYATQLESVQLAATVESVDTDCGLAS